MTAHPEPNDHSVPLSAPAEKAPADIQSAAGAPAWLVVLEVGYLFGLVGLLLWYRDTDTLRALVPAQVGPVPLAIPWWGALGGVTISLTGIFRNARDWQSSYEAWHVARPILGAVVGTVGFLIFVVVIRATGSSLDGQSATGRAAFDLVAFLVGYREDIFRQLLKRATDVLFSTDSKAQKAGGDRGAG